jgi:hypothetical protein
MSERKDLRFDLADLPGAPRVSMRLRRRGDRWIATAELETGPAAAVGVTPRAALTSSLATLDARRRTELLADPGLMAVSLRMLSGGEPSDAWRR